MCERERDRDRETEIERQREREREGERGRERERGQDPFRFFPTNGSSFVSIKKSSNFEGALQQIRKPQLQQSDSNPSLR